ncbi:MAG: FHA domain-containing protein [Parvibaculaceae bacterium]|nr:FHA domain-containing protein [Parvibaculaceae bacterium]|tara:strand:+ start:18216 stop:18590 length:375 start_codon:yes stop_codon:yes gene_type:complete
MKTFAIGRDKASDIRLSDNSVSGQHAELVITVGNDLYLTDCASTNGTFVMSEAGPIRLRQDFVQIEDRLLFGRYEMTVNELLRLAKEADARRRGQHSGQDDKPDETIEGAVRRDEFGRPVAKGE